MKDYSEEHRRRVREQYLAQYDFNPMGARRINFAEMLERSNSADVDPDVLARAIVKRMERPSNSDAKFLTALGITPYDLEAVESQLEDASE